MGARSVPAHREVRAGIPGFEEDLDVDSLGVVELLMALEDNFDVKIPDEEAEKITTVGEAAEMVSQKLNS